MKKFSSLVLCAAAFACSPRAGLEAEHASKLSTDEKAALLARDYHVACTGDELDIAHKEEIPQLLAIVEENEKACVPSEEDEKLGVFACTIGDIDVETTCHKWCEWRGCRNTGHCSFMASISGSVQTHNVQGTVSFHTTIVVNNSPHGMGTFTVRSIEVDNGAAITIPIGKTNLTFTSGTTGSGDPSVTVGGSVSGSTASGISSVGKVIFTIDATCASGHTIELKVALPLTPGTP